MRIIETKVYKFDELTEEGKRKAIENLYDINVDYDWWDCIYEDAERIGLKISEFDLDRGSYVKGDFIWSAYQTANEIIKEHGPACYTVQTAKDYLAEFAKLVAEHCQEDADELCDPEKDWDFIFDACFEGYAGMNNTEDIDAEFLKSLCEDYRIILQNEYDYLTMWGGKEMLDYTKKEITVHMNPRISREETEKVKALLVGGPEGVLAVWRDVNNKSIVHIATGDDGFWREIASYHERWIPDILCALGAI